LLAAHRGGIEIVLIPEENRRDLADIPKNIQSQLDIRPVQWIDEVLTVALQHMPVPLPEAGEKISGSDKEEPTKGSKENGVRAH
jgi:ATP-dependent Lon protease